MSLWYLNYVPGQYEEVTQKLPDIVGGEWTYFVLDGYFKFELSDVVLKDSDGIPYPESAYELSIDTDYTSIEGSYSGKTLYSMFRFKTAEYDGQTLYVTGNNFGSMIDNEQMVKYVDNKVLGSTDLEIDIVNTSGVPLQKGLVVYPDGPVGALPADAHLTEKCRLLAVVKETIPNGQSGKLRKFGRVEGTVEDPFDLSAFSEGDFLRLKDDGSGWYTVDLPIDGSYDCLIGVVESNDSVTGTLFVDILVAELTAEVTDTNGFPAVERYATHMTITTTPGGPHTFNLKRSGVDRFHFYELGQKYEKSLDQSIPFSNTEGIWWIYNSLGTLVSVFDPSPALKESIILNKAFVASFWWNATDEKVEIDIQDERHGIGITPMDHLWKHKHFGAQYTSGFTIGDVIADGDGNSETSVQYSITAGSYDDEDLKHESRNMSKTDPKVIAWLEGASANVRSGTNSYYGAKTNVSGFPVYNFWNGSAWVLQQVSNNSFYLMHQFTFNGQPVDGVYITEAVNNVIMMGQNEYATLSLAREGANAEIANLKSSIAFAELVECQTFIYEHKSSYTNGLKSRIRKTDTGDDYVQWLGAEMKPGNTPGSHANLSDVFDAGVGIAKGHVSSLAQTIAGKKTFSDGVAVPPAVLPEDALRKDQLTSFTYKVSSKAEFEVAISSGGSGNVVRSIEVINSFYLSGTITPTFPCIVSGAPVLISGATTLNLTVYPMLFVSPLDTGTDPVTITVNGTTGSYCRFKVFRSFFGQTLGALTLAGTCPEILYEESDAPITGGTQNYWDNTFGYLPTTTESATDILARGGGALVSVDAMKERGLILVRPEETETDLNAGIFLLSGEYRTKAVSALTNAPTVSDTVRRLRIITSADANYVTQTAILLNTSDSTEQEIWHRAFLVTTPTTWEKVVYQSKPATTQTAQQNATAGPKGLWSQEGFEYAYPVIKTRASSRTSFSAGTYNVTIVLNTTVSLTEIAISIIAQDGSGFNAVRKSLVRQSGSAVSENVLVSDQPYAPTAQIGAATNISSTSFRFTVTIGGSNYIGVIADSTAGITSITVA